MRQTHERISSPRWWKYCAICSGHAGPRSSRLSAILAEIRNYPSSIAACDQQVNYLLEQRDRFVDELSRLASTRRDSLTGESGVEAFVGSSRRPTVSLLS
jgi:hypothetical protein